MSKPRLIAFYLPQFYPTTENDEWWGKGFLNGRPQINEGGNQYEPWHYSLYADRGLLPRKPGFFGRSEREKVLSPGLW